MNQAETIHFSWTKRGEEDLTFLEAAQADALANVMLETEYSHLREGGKETGTGPSLASREIKKAQEEINGS